MMKANPCFQWNPETESRGMYVCMAIKYINKIRIFKRFIKGMCVHTSINSTLFLLLSSTGNQGGQGFIFAKTIPIHTTIPIELYNEAKEKGLNFSKILTRSIKEFTPEQKQTGIKCDYCGELIDNGNIKWIFMNEKAFTDWKQGTPKVTRVCKVCKVKHNDLPDEEIIRKCIAYKYQSWKMARELEEINK